MEETVPDGNSVFVMYRTAEFIPPAMAVAKLDVGLIPRSRSEELVASSYGEKG